MIFKIDLYIFLSKYQLLFFFRSGPMCGCQGVLRDFSALLCGCLVVSHLANVKKANPQVSRIFVLSRYGLQLRLVTYSTGRISLP